MVASVPTAAGVLGRPSSVRCLISTLKDFNPIANRLLSLLFANSCVFILRKAKSRGIVVAEPDDPLVARAAPGEGDVPLRLNERPVHHHVDAAEHPPALRVGLQFLSRESRPAPDVLRGENRPDPLKEWREDGAVLWLEGLAAQDGQAPDVVRREEAENMFLRPPR